MLLVETDISAEWDRSIDWLGIAERAVHSAVANSSHASLSARDAEVSIKLTSDAEIRALNLAWRGKDKATNVLSFPMAAGRDLESAPMLGDIVLAYGVCAREAAERQIQIEAHAAHLVVHGALHLLGYDHEPSDGHAEEMEAVERRALGALGIADPYKLTEVQP